VLLASVLSMLTEGVSPSVLPLCVVSCCCGCFCMLLLLSVVCVLVSCACVFVLVFVCVSVCTPVAVPPALSVSVGVVALLLLLLLCLPSIKRSCCASHSCTIQSVSAVAVVLPYALLNTGCKSCVSAALSSTALSCGSC
jgi:hypothetical protein